MECLNSILMRPLGRLVKAHLKKPAEGASEESLRREDLKEVSEKFFEEPPRELRERHHRPCRWHQAIVSTHT